MTQLVWDEVGKHLYETGSSHGVIALLDDKGVYGKPAAWTGLRSVTNSPDGAEETALYADDVKYLSLFSAENFKGSIGAYTYPDEFAIANGELDLVPGITVEQQTRKTFGFSYQTILGNDVKGNEYGTKLHIVYGAKAQPSEKGYESVNDDPSAVELEWDFVTTPVDVDGTKKTAHLVIDSTKIAPGDFKKITDALYGTSGTEPKFLLPSEIMALSTKKPQVTSTAV